MSANIKKYRKAFEASQIVLDFTKVDEFPIDFYDFFAKRKRAPILVSSLKDYNTWLQKVNPIKATPLFIYDAKCVYYPNRNTYLIIYNENRQKTRIRFSFAHELGHIMLGHLDDERTEISRGGVDDRTYYIMEGEANTFAGNFLAPPILIQDWLENSLFNATSVADRFNISPSASKDYRAEDYKYWKTTHPSARERSILKRCREGLHRRKCTACQSLSSIKNARYCPICGSNSISICNSERGVTEVKYSSVKTDKTGHVLECPNCRNEEFPENSEYCMICGKVTVNRCTFAIQDDVPYEMGQCQHTEPLPGNARYCPYCGSEATFLRYEILKPWGQSQDDLQQIKPDENPFDLPY